MALLPVHALAPDLGFALKPWFVPLLALLVLDRRDVVRRARQLPPLVAVGWLLILVGALLGLLAGPAEVVAGRHVLALAATGLTMLVAPALASERRAAALGVRVGGFLMAVPALIESLALHAGVGVERLLVGVPGLVAPLGEVIYGDILVPHGLHVGSNFLALYCLVWLFLIVAFPHPRWGAGADALLAGLLLLAAAVTFSRTAALTLFLAGLVYLAGRRLSHHRPAPAFRLWVLALTVLVGGGLVVTADATDGREQLLAAVNKRMGHTVDEGSELLSGLTPAAQGEPSPFTLHLEDYTEWSPPRAQLWSAYTQAAVRHPLTGIGFGVGDREFKNYAHNLLLEAAGGGGVAAATGTVLLWFGAATTLWRRPWGRHEVALAAAVTAFLVASALLSTNYSPLGGMLLGLCVLDGGGGMRPRS